MAQIRLSLLLTPHADRTTWCKVRNARFLRTVDTQVQSVQGKGPAYFIGIYGVFTDLYLHTSQVPGVARLKCTEDLRLKFYLDTFQVTDKSTQGWAELMKSTYMTLLFQWDVPCRRSAIGQALGLRRRSVGTSPNFPSPQKRIMGLPWLEGADLGVVPDCNQRPRFELREVGLYKWGLSVWPVSL